MYRPLLAALVVSAINLSADSGSGRQTAPAPIHLPAIVFVQTSKIVGAIGPERFPEGSRIALLSPEAKSTSALSLTDGFFAAADPQIDFTGKRVLFAAERSRGEHWQVWEMNLDGTGIRQITKCGSDCVRPAYLPGDEIVFTNMSAESGHRKLSLAVVGLDGSNARPITFGPGEWWLETVLRDGRIVASANAPLVEDPSAKANRLLYTMRPDGTGLESLRCEHANQASRGEASELDDASIVFTENAGTLMLVKRGARHEEKIGASPASYRWPNALQGDFVIAARKSATGLRYQLVLLSADGHGEPRVIYSVAEADSVEPVAVQARPVPKKFFSNLILTSPTGYFISLDSSNSPESSENAPSAHRVRLMAQRPTGEVVLGEAPVEPDGSFYVQVPANQAVRFVLLDAQDKVVREEHSWVWARPGEQRGCTGCHGDKALAPENRWPMALKKQDPPTNLSGSASDVPTVENHGH